MAKMALTEKPHGRPSRKYPGAEKLLKEYATATGKELADRYGIALSTVEVWIRKARKEIADDEKKSNHKTGMVLLTPQTSIEELASLCDSRHFVVTTEDIDKMIETARERAERTDDNSDDTRKENE